MKKKRSESIRTRLLGPLFILLVLQAAVIAGTVFFGGVSVKLKNNELNVLTKNTENTKLRLEKETIHHWIVMLNNSRFMSGEIQQILENDGREPKDIYKDYVLNREIVDTIMEKSIEMLHLSYATGAFMYLNGPAAANGPEDMKAGFYIRNSNPGGYLNDNSSLLMERGLPSLAEKYHIPLDSFWQLGFFDSGEKGAAKFYKLPYLAAIQRKAIPEDTMEYAYLSPPFRLSPNDIPVITYSVPIILEDGTVAGVYGLEMSVNQLEQILGEVQISSSFDECWVLGIRKKGTGSMIPVADSGILFDQYFNKSGSLDYIDNEKENISSLTSPDGTKWYAAMENLEVYGTGGPFSEEEWVLVGMARQKDLLAFYNAVRRMLLSSMLVPLVFSLLGAYMIGRIVTEPIRRLGAELGKKSGSIGISLERVYVREIDELTETIELLNRNAERTSLKMSGILEHANVLVGVFEYEAGKDRVFCSKSLFEMLGWGTIGGPFCYLQTDEFKAFLEQTFGRIEEKGERILRCIQTPEGKRWIEITLDESQKGTVMGVCTDVTANVEEKEKLERERNYDLLTEIYNRRAFREQTQAAIKRITNECAAVIMWDLDNLKYINDTYGHDEGDRYIVLFANCLKKFMESGGIISRYSGDEFVVFLKGKEKEEIRKAVRDFMKYIREFTLNMKGGYEFPIRVSGGLSWYPDDARDFDTLFNYADFAMYMVKHSVKGVVKEFDITEHTHNSYMLTGSEELNRMLDRKEVRFAFQPIATREGAVYGYELLMRPEFMNIKGISEVLNLTRAQAKLPQMEILTWFAGLRAAKAEEEAGQLGRDEKLFINSIASVCLTKEGQKELEEQYGQLLSRIVIEMTEGEPASQNFMQCKIDMARQWGGLTAIDDFGTGYNSESILLHMKPDIVKMDMSLIRRIHEDPNRQIILKNLLNFAEKNHIRVLAEGVETAEELEFLMDCGVYLFQGYYIARPQMEIRPLDPYIVKKMQEFSGKTR
ncbi:EAL domain-containing protein [Lacrimispora sp. JR3]|uniref:EAL domain-containing protein n=1 Tax=Lacrimispora sinapis TaxID=3111456 RepID=UPI00374A4553